MRRREHGDRIAEQVLSEVVASQVASLLTALRARVGSIETRWRLLHLPPPTRDSPRPDPDAIRIARLLEESGRRLDHIGGRLRTLPVQGRSDETMDALDAHLRFLLALTEADETADADALLASVAHLSDLAERLPR